MSEPRTSARVILHTSKGPIELELWAKEVPIASRNFLQLCKNGYFDGTMFHRVVKDFVIQGGDPSGTGYGGESIYPEGLFKDEFHSRIKYSRRGMLACANSGKADTNASQFVITLAATPGLQNKNTLFGKVVGETYFNVMKIAEAEVDEDERPLYPTKIERAEIIEPYFDDLTEPAKAVGKKPKVAAKKKKAKKGVLNLDDEDEDVGVMPARKKIRPAHELLKDKSLQDHKGKASESLSKNGNESKTMREDTTVESSKDGDSSKPASTDGKKGKSGIFTGSKLHSSEIKKHGSTMISKPASKSSDRENETLKMLENFNSKLDTLDEGWSASSSEEEQYSD